MTSAFSTPRACKSPAGVSHGSGGRVGKSSSNPSSLRSTVRTPLTVRSEEHTSELQSRLHLVCRLLLEKKNATLTLHLSLSGNAYADYPLTLDEYGICLWSLTGLPEGVYEATLDGFEAAASFEITQYRLAPLHAELVQQQLSGETLRYTLAVTAFGQPYTGSIEGELQERGQRIGGRAELD